MMVRFFDHGDGSGTSAVDYLLAEEVAAYTEDRKRIPGRTIQRNVLPELISGDAELTRHLIDSNIRKWRYTSGVVAFHADDDPSGDQQAAVMRDFEKAAFAGLENDQGNILWVRHRHMGNVELHFLIPRVELYGNRSFNPAPPGSEAYFNAFRDYWNARENWASPDDLARKQMVKPVFDFGDRKQIKETIQTLIIQKIETGEIHNHADVRTTIATLDGLEFKPLTEKQLEKRHRADAVEASGGKPRRRDTRITLRVAGTSGSQNTFRLEDRIFHEDWTADEYFAAKSESEGRDPIPRNRRADTEDVERLRAEFDASVERRAAKNRPRFAQTRKLEQADQRTNGQSDRISGTQNTAGYGCTGREPNGMAHGHMENDVANISGRGLSDLLGALDGGTFNISEARAETATSRLGDTRLGRHESNAWPWWFGPGFESTPRRGTHRLPDPQPRTQRDLHRDIYHEVNHAPNTTDAFRDRALARCRRTEYHLRDWFEERQRFTERIHEFEARIQSVRSRFGETLGRIAEAAGRIATIVGEWLIKRHISPINPELEKKRAKHVAPPLSSGPGL